MWHPLLDDLTVLKDQDIELRIFDLSKKYAQAARQQAGNLTDQLLLTIDAYRDEQQRRLRSRAVVPMKNKDTQQDLSTLININ